MARIEKLIQPPYFDPVDDGSKPFEVRLGNLEVNPGDVIVLTEWDPDEKNQQEE